MQGPMVTVPTRIVVNGTPHTLTLDPRSSLLDVLREQLALTGAKKGCDHGQCGACTVHLDGRRVASCLTPAVQADGRHVTTIEGLSPADGDLHPMQQAFVDHDALQCGYCTPGQIMAAVACVREGPRHVAGADSRVHERQHLPLRRLRRHRRGHRGCRAQDAMNDPHAHFVRCPRGGQRCPSSSAACKASEPFGRPRGTLNSSDASFHLHEARKRRGSGSGDRGGRPRDSLSRGRYNVVRPHEAERGGAVVHRRRQFAGGAPRLRHVGFERAGVRRHGPDERRRRRPEADTRLSGALGIVVARGFAAAPQHGEPRRQSAPAHALRLFSRR